MNISSSYRKHPLMISRGCWYICAFCELPSTPAPHHPIVNMLAYDNEFIERFPERMGFSPKALQAVHHGQYLRRSDRGHRPVVPPGSVDPDTVWNRIDHLSLTWRRLFPPHNSFLSLERRGKTSLENAFLRWELEIHTYMTHRSSVHYSEGVVRRPRP